jgi:sporulation protein YhbH
MTVTKHSGLPSGRGERDAQHHKDRVRKQITEHLKKNIGGEDIITGKGKMRVPVKGNKRYQFIFDRGKSGDGPGAGPNGAGNEPGAEDYEVWMDMAEVEELLFAELALPRLKPKKETDAEVSDYRFDTIAIKGPQVDKRYTLRRALLRNAIQGKKGLENFEKDDLRYMSYREKPRPKSKAVMFLAMDVSGSMDERKKQIARLFDYWTVRFLRHRYDTVEIIFISHTTDAREVTEHEFFNRVESGGTKISSAYRLIQRIQKERFPTSEWNIYVMHASDGDNWQLDNQEVHAAITELCKVCSLVGYLEITDSQMSGWGYRPSQTLTKTMEKMGSPGKEFMTAEVATEQDIWGAIKHFFQKDDVEQAVSA